MYQRFRSSIAFPLLFVERLRLTTVKYDQNLRLVHRQLGIIRKYVMILLR